MDRGRKIQLNRAIAEIENLYPADDMIVNYADFLKFRNYLHCYQFNPAVLHHLLKIINDNWTTEKRINRLSLLTVIKRYFSITCPNRNNFHRSTAKAKEYEFSTEIRLQLFQLFKNAFEKRNFISIHQIDDVKKICNYLLINIPLFKTEEEWFCENYLKSELIVNRILRYPIKSEVISNWAKKNFLQNCLRGRRAELLSWVIDMEPEFDIDEQVMIDDFNCQNDMDVQAIRNYADELAANEIIERDLGDVMPKTKRPSLSFLDYKEGEELEEIVQLSHPELKLSKRFYIIPMVDGVDYTNRLPDFKKLRTEFLKNADKFLKMTMIWGIGYSRLDNNSKSLLIKKYYTPETFYSIYKVCIKNKNIELLQWLLEQK